MDYGFQHIDAALSGILSVVDNSFADFGNSLLLDGYKILDLGLTAANDIGWTFDDTLAANLGMNGNDHRHFLNQFYTGRFEGSFASGVAFGKTSKPVIAEYVVHWLWLTSANISSL